MNITAITNLGLRARKLEGEALAALCALEVAKAAHAKAARAARAASEEYTLAREEHVRAARPGSIRT